MHKTLAGCGVAVLGLLGSLTVGAPANAAPAATGIYISDATLAPGGVREGVELTIAFDEDFLLLADTTVVYDFGKAAQVVAVTSDDEDWDTCAASGTKLTCKLTEWEVYDGDDILPTVTLTAPKDAKVGATGEVAVTLTDTGAGKFTTTSRVRIGEAVDLKAGGAQKLTVAKDKGFARTLQVTNAGRKVVESAVAVFEGTNNVVDDGTDFNNCGYDEDGYVVACTFAQHLAAGKTYAAALPMLVGDGAMAPGRQRSEVLWMTAAEAEDYLGEEAGEPGGGEALQLQPARRRADQADTNPGDNSSVADITVTGKHGLDVSVTGTTASGKPGSEVELVVQYTNNGPADLETVDEDKAVTAVDVTLPDGVTLVGEPDQGCELLTGRTYRCYAWSPLLAVGDSEWCTFRVRIDRAGGKGSVTLAGDEYTLLQLADDLDKGNNAADLVIKG